MQDRILYRFVNIQRLQQSFTIVEQKHLSVADEVPL